MRWNLRVHVCAPACFAPPRLITTTDANVKRAHIKKRRALNEGLNSTSRRITAFQLNKVFRLKLI